MPRSMAARLPTDEDLMGIPSAGAFDSLTRSLHHEWSHLTTNPHGEMSGRQHEGFLVAGTAFVTHYRLLGEGQPLVYTYSNRVSSTEWSSVAMIRESNSQKSVADGVVPNGSIEVRSLRVLRGGWSEAIFVTNHSNHERETELEIEVGCPITDKSPIKVQGVKARKKGVRPRVLKDDRDSCILFFRHEFGKRKKAPVPELRKEMGIHVPHEGDPVVRNLLLDISREDNDSGRKGDCQFRIKKGRVTRIKARLRIEARQEIQIRLRFSVSIDGKQIAAPENQGIEPVPVHESDGSPHGSRVLTGNSTFNLMLTQARRDLQDLLLPVFGSGHSNPWSLSAGVPGYEAFYGDDSLTGAWQSCIFSPRYLHDSVERAGLYQGVREYPWRDEEPGRLAHQRNWGPLDALGKRNKEIYYGDNETTPFWIITLATAFFWGGHQDFLKRNERTLSGCLDWILRKLDEGEGFLYYHPATKDSTRNQGWKDSDTAIVDSHGKIRTPPLATVELQGYCYIALILAAALYLELGVLEKARKLFDRSQRLFNDFNREFWMAEKSFYALALDGKRRQVDAISSNVGHCLGCGIIESSRLKAVVKRLLSPEMFSGWGIRTLSTDNPAFDPFSYHRGSVWAPECATIAAGMRLCGFDQEAATIIEALFATATLYNQMRLPEAIGGQTRSERAPIPGIYPNSNVLQLWSVSSIPFAMQVLLGLLPVAPIKTLFVRPFIPEWLSWVELKGLRVGEASVDLRFRRDEAGQSRWEILSQKGICRVIEQPMPFDPSVTLRERLFTAFKSAA